MAYGESSPSDLDKNTPNAQFVHVGAVQDELHYKNGACVLRVQGRDAGASGVDADEHVYEAGAPYALRQH